MGGLLAAGGAGADEEEAEEEEEEEAGGAAGAVASPGSAATALAPTLPLLGRITTLVGPSKVSGGPTGDRSNDCAESACTSEPRCSCSRKTTAGGGRIAGPVPGIWVA